MGDKDSYQTISDDDTSRSARLSLARTLGPAFQAVGKILWVRGDSITEIGTLLRHWSASW